MAGEETTQVADQGGVTTSAPAAAPAPAQAAPAAAPAPAQAAPAAAPAASPQVPDVPGNHAKLLGMLHGLESKLTVGGVTLSAAGKALATHGKEGGAQDVTNYFEQQRQEKRAERAQGMQEEQQKSEQELRGAQTIALQANTQALMAKMPVEIQQAHTDLITKTTKMYEDAGYAPQVAFAMAARDDASTIHSNVMEAYKPNGNLGNSVLTGTYDHAAGKGQVQVGSRADLAQINLPKSSLAPSLMSMGNMIDVAEANGVDSKIVADSRAKLKTFQDMPDTGNVNAADWQDFATHFQSQIVQGTKAKQEITEAKTKQAQAASATEAAKSADPVTKLSSPDELAKPGAKASISAMIADPKTDAADIPRLKALLPKADVATLAVTNTKMREMRAQQVINQGDPAAAGALLANRTLTIPELKNRSVTPDFIVKAVTAAQKIDPTFKAPEAEGQAHVAANATNQQFFGNTDSLLISGGTLDQLSNASKNLGPGQIPAFNSVSNLVSAATGQGAISAYAAAILGVSDDYAKVMGGAIGTDTARQQIMDRLKPATSREGIDAVVNQFRQQVNSQREGRIGSNPYLRDMYPKPPQGGQVTVTDPAGGSHVFTDAKAADAFRSKFPGSR